MDKFTFSNKSILTFEGSNQSIAQELNYNESIAPLGYNINNMKQLSRAIEEVEEEEHQSTQG